MLQGPAPCWIFSFVSVQPHCTRSASLNQSMFWIFLFFFSFLVGGGQELRDYSDMGYTYKIKGHIAWPSLKDTNGNAY